MSKKKIILILLILCIPAVWAIFVPGFWGASDEMHIAWLGEMNRVIQIFQFPVRLVPDLSYGFGYPLFNFIFPLPYYLGEIFHLLGFSLIASLKVVFLISILFSAVGMYYLLREFVNERLSFLGALVYVYTPYRATEIYVRGAVGEALAFVFLPLTTFCLIKLVKNLNFKWSALLGLSLGGLILTHNIIAYLFTPFLLILAIAFIITFEKKAKLLGLITFGFLLGLGISLFFWLPALIDSSLMQYSTVFNYWDHFPTLKQLITPYFGYGSSVPGPGDGMSFFLGIANIILVFLGTILYIRQFSKYDKITKTFLSWGIGIFLVSIFLMNFRSAFIWKSFPLLPYFQFPWRFLTLTTFISALLVIPLSKLKIKNPVLYLLILLLILINFSYFRPQDFFPKRNDSYFLSKYLPINGASVEYKNLKEEYLRLPKTTQERPEKLFDRFFSEGVKIEYQEINALDGEAIIAVGKETIINYNKYYFPGWQGEINGKPLKLFAGMPYGQISFIVPQGESRVKIFFRETVRNKIFDYVSLFSLGLAVVLISHVRKNKKI